MHEGHCTIASQKWYWQLITSIAFRHCDMLQASLALCNAVQWNWANLHNVHDSMSHAALCCSYASQGAARGVLFIRLSALALTHFDEVSDCAHRDTTARACAQEHLTTHCNLQCTMRKSHTWREIQLHCDRAHCRLASTSLMCLGLASRTH